MSDDRTTGRPPSNGDWRSDALDLTEVPEPYRVRMIHAALKELDQADRNTVALIELRIRAWEKSIDRRMAAVVHQAAEEAGTRFSSQVLRELGKISARLEAVEALADSAKDDAGRAVEESGRYRPVVVNVVDRQEAPEIPSDPAIPNLSRWEQTKKTARKPSTIVGVVVAIVYAVVNAWLASRQ